MSLQSSAARLAEARALAEAGFETGPSAATLGSEVFDGFPYGIMVTNGARKVIAFNQALTDILGYPYAGPPAATCCDLLGCGRRGTPLEAGCLTRRAQDSSSPLPEVHVELTTGGERIAVAVTASPLDTATRRVVFEIRAANRGLAPPTTGMRLEPRLHIFALGRMHVEGPAGAIGGAWLEQRPGEMLKLLVAERGRIVSVDEIAEALWARPGDRTRTNIRYTVHALRDRLEPDRPRRNGPSLVLSHRGGYSLDRSRTQIDADEFEQQARRGLSASAIGDADLARIHLNRAMRLYRGEFLADDPYTQWALPERHRLHDLAGRSLRVLWDIHAQQGELEEASDSAARLAAMEPYDVEIHRRLIELCLRRGRRSEAMRRYEALRGRLRSQFDEDPGFELRDLRVGSSPIPPPLPG